MSTTTTPATHKAAIVAGQRFGPIPLETPNEAIREQLKTMGFADVASAEIKEGRDGEAITVEFVKKAGTKGLDPAGLAALLAAVPAVEMGRVAVPPGLPRDATALLRRLAAGALTCEQALDPRVNEALKQAYLTADYDDDDEDGRAVVTREGEMLCSRCDTLPAVAGLAPSGW